jgi:hypothetical protein
VGRHGRVLDGGSWHNEFNMRLILPDLLGLNISHITFYLQEQEGDLF